MAMGIQHQFPYLASAAAGLIYKVYKTWEVWAGREGHPDPLGSLCLQLVWFPLDGGVSHVDFENIY